MTTKTTKKTTTKKTARKATPKKATPKKAPARNPARANTAATAAKGKPETTPGAKVTKNATPATPSKRNGKKRVGILDAAAHILAETGGTMSCQAIVNIAIESGAWKTNGKTPHATLYAAMTREIARKGTGARFVKTGRGLFAAAKTGKGA